jgi:hypothetical protein
MQAGAPMQTGAPADPHTSDAFRSTASVNLIPLSVGGPLVYVHPDGTPEARVIVNRLAGGVSDAARALLSGQSVHHLEERHTCLDLDDIPLFYVQRYRAVDGAAFAVFRPDGDAMAAYVPYRNVFRKEVEIRDSTGAPVAAMRHSRHHRLDLFETGGSQIAVCWREDVDLGSFVDDKWGLTVFAEPRCLDRRAIVAAPLICRLLSYRGPRQKHPHNLIATGIEPVAVEAGLRLSFSSAGPAPSRTPLWLAG